MDKSCLFENALFHTGRTEDETFKYMLVENGRIKALSNLRPENCGRVIDLGGGHVYPCLADPHTHLLYSIVLAAMGFDICSIEAGGVVPNTMAGVEERLRAFAAGKKKDELLVANNYILSAIDLRRLPNRHELDDWCGGRPVVIYTIDGHASALSTAMLKKLGIEPEGHDGILMGEAHERIQGRLTDTISSAVTPRVLARGIANIENACAAWGISHVGALEGNGDSKQDLTTRLMLFLARRMDLQVRMYFQYLDSERAAKLAKYQKKPRIGGCGDWEMDGAIGAHSAAFERAYKDSGKKADCYYSPEQVERAVRLADEKGFQIASHAIGDRAIERIASALARTKPGRLHRLEHGEFPGEDSMEFIKSGRFAVVMQPGYSWIDRHYLHSYEQFLQKESIMQTRLRSLVEAGVCVCSSSDSPVQSMDPYMQMRGMVEFYREEESISTYEAFCCASINAAKALEEEKNIGSLEVGKEASFFVSDRELFSLPPEQLSGFRARETWYRGKRWQNKKGSLTELMLQLLKKPHKV